MAPTGAISPKQAGYDLVRTPRMSPENMQMIQQLRGQIQPGALKGADYLSRLAGGDESLFQQMEAPAFRQLNALQGQTASRFSGLGTGARRSSGFQNTIGNQQVDLAERLAANRMGLQHGAINQLMSLYRDLIGEDEFQYDLTERGNDWSKWIGASLPFVGAGTGALLGLAGGPGGALAGAKIGSAAGSTASKAFFK